MTATPATRRPATALADRFPGASPSAAERALAKAVELGAPVDVVGGQDGYLLLAVPSATAPDRAYLVRLDERDRAIGCTCDAGDRPVCWHRAAALLWLAEHPDRRTPAPSPAPASSSRPAVRRVDLL